MTDPYEQVVVAILRENNLTPAQLKVRYAAYQEKRAEFEKGLCTLDEMTATVTPEVAAMIGLEEMMLGDLHRARTPHDIADAPDDIAEAPVRQRPQFTPWTYVLFALIITFWVVVAVGIARG